MTKTIWNEVTLYSQLWANEIASLKGGIMNQFRVHDDLLPLVWESPYYFPPSVGEPMDQDESDSEPTLSQTPVGSSSLADRLDYGEGGSLTLLRADPNEGFRSVTEVTNEVTLNNEGLEPKDLASMSWVAPSRNMDNSNIIDYNKFVVMILQELDVDVDRLYQALDDMVLDYHDFPAICHSAIDGYPGKVNSGMPKWPFREIVPFGLHCLL
ncbi:hypothetical protein M422DRAFT_248630 [Sphaerobolus stellatus SS14]|nr:hypothetical protein M422DRAFT_248630 [Sphaerobolus stellatus SS14]